MDDAALLAEQYADPDNLGARIALHERYTTAPEPWWPWVFDRLLAAADAAGAPDDADVLEVGCGRGDLWAANADAVPDGWSVLATDLSDGMLAEFAERTGPADLTPGATARAAAGALPFPDDAFDVAVANHVLYHVDRERALPGLRRVLRPGGRLVATTNGEHNLSELRALLEAAGADWTPSTEAFSLQSGPDQLRRVFDAVERHDYDGGLRVPDVEPLVAYAGSLPDMDERRVERFADLAADALAGGPLEVAKEQGALVAVVAP
jgi:SAM-dependent methyltransferase